MHFRLVILVMLLAVSPAWGQGFRSRGRPSADGIAAADVVQAEGVITSLTRLKDGKIKMKIAELQDSEEKKEKPETQTFTLDWRTMVYKLTDRNRQIFKEQDKIEDVVEDVNKLHHRLKDLPDKESRLLASYRGSVYVYSSGWVDAHESIDPFAAADLSEALRAYQREEEERRNHYGPGVKLRVDMTVIVFAGRSNDTTYAVLVTGKKAPAKKEKEKPPAESPGKAKETEAARKLKFAKGLSRDAENAMGAERERLSRLAKARLQEVIDKYPGTTAALEAKKLLEDK